MKSLAWKPDASRPTERNDIATRRTSAASTPAPTINTILAVREHAPAEIEELDGEIRHLHHRLSAAHARKRLLEQLLGVIYRADSEVASEQTGIAVVR